MKFFFITIGTLSVGLGTAGIFLPLLPTTPFLLLAAYCYAKSSNRFHNWLIHHKWLGPYIQCFNSKKGVPIRVKVKAITIMWVTMGTSAYFLREKTITLIIIGIAAICLTLFLLSLKTDKSTPTSI